MSAADLPLGLIRGMSNEAYHATDALGSTGLKRLAKSPAHFKGAVMKRTAALSFGSLVHTLILEPETFLTRYSVKPNDHDGRTRQGKAWLEALGEREAITHAEHDAAVAMRDSLMRLPDARALFSTGEAEVSAFWLDPATGVQCKARPDWLRKGSRPGARVAVDVKSCEDASPAGFAAAVARFGYHIQQAHYEDGITCATGDEVEAFIFAAIEKEPPYAAALYILNDEAVAKGRAEAQRLRALYAECKATDTWPAYGESIQVLTLPKWA